MENGGEHSEERFEFDRAKEHVTSYINNKIAYFKLSVIEGLSGILPGLVLILLLTLFIFTFWLFANIAAVMWLIDALGTAAGAYLIMGGVNLLLGGVLIAFYKPLLQKPLADMFVKMLTEKMGGSENE